MLCLLPNFAFLTLFVRTSAYRALYLLNWIYRYFHEPGYRHWIGAVGALPLR